MHLIHNGDSTVITAGECDPESLFDGEIACYTNEDGEVIELTTCDDFEMLIDCFEEEAKIDVKILIGRVNGTRTKVHRAPQNIKVRKLPTNVHQGTILSMCFSYDHTKLISTGKDSRTVLYDIQREKVLWSDKSKSAILSSAYSPVRDHFVTGDERSNIRLFDAQDVMCLKKKATYSLSDKGSFKTYALDYLPSGGHLAAGGTASQMLILDTVSGIPVVRHDTPTAVFAVKSVDSAVVAYAPDRPHDIQSVDIRGTINPLPVMKGHSQTIWSVQVSECGNEILSTGMDGTARIFDIRTGNALTNITASPSPLQKAIYIGDSHIATCGRKSVIGFWNIHSGACVTSYTIPAVHMSYLASMCYSHNQLFCSSGSSMYDVSW
eukprot:TRINITY_DN37323_c0_g1_i1.p1 TRINITY_DN37323_c0_g1~~TRINITY_DN37323_c0_g1_i1.p1  ORF type:complete len:397 (+),score=53.10 TRINITY_DN37323_c0_g1_i1:56-1192(+)